MSTAGASGYRWVEVDPERLPRWLDGFAHRHGPAYASVEDDAVVVVAADGERATLYPPPGAGRPVDLTDLVARAAVPRRLGLLLARRGGYAVGVAAGPELVTSKVDSRYVQGRTAAGGWSQQRFARRRDNQARAAVGDAAGAAARLLVPAVAELSALVTGGDHRFVAEVLADPRLAGLRTLCSERFLAVPDPKLAVLRAAVRSARAVRIRLPG